VYGRAPDRRALPGRAREGFGSCVLFDVDGVLVDSEERNGAVIRAVLAEAGVAVSERYDDLAGMQVAEMLHRIADLEGLDGRALVVRWRRAALDAARHGHRLVEGAAATVAWLGRHGVLVGAVSSAEGWYVRTICADVGIPPSAPVVSGDDVRRGKPDPEPYRRGLQLSGFGPDRCIAVEDSAHGAQSAVSAGLRVVAFGAGASRLADVTAAHARDMPALRHELSRLLEVPPT